jgi:hypothetical protein
LNWNKWVRQINRGLSVAFTVAVITNIVALGQEAPAVSGPGKQPNEVQAI